MRLKFSIFALVCLALTGCPDSKAPDTKSAPSAEPAKATAAPAASAQPAAKEEDKGGW